MEYPDLPEAPEKAISAFRTVKENSYVPHRTLHLLNPETSESASNRPFCLPLPIGFEYFYEQDASKALLSPGEEPAHLMPSSLASTNVPHQPSLEPRIEPVRSIQGITIICITRGGSKPSSSSYPGYSDPGDPPQARPDPSSLASNDPKPA
ncbi:hypothetical protein QYF36_023997 [Acer negundo]|nr:hypothetical protein QYF36_003612 [Acer negundo]KAK4839682.1 hypothetical protein QYF36_023997 [Acer negundo]